MGVVKDTFLRGEQTRLIDLIYLPESGVFETASTEVTDHLFGVTHLPKAQIP